MDESIRYVHDKANWTLSYDRRLFREIRTITGVVVMVTASTIGASVKFEAEPTEGSSVKTIQDKVFVEDEMTELAHSEGWPPKLLHYTDRLSLAHKLIDELKIVTEYGVPRLESRHYPERAMLAIALHGGLHAPDIILGSVEIHEHHTLVDLRTIIKHELDDVGVPKAYRFIFRGSPCGLKQEPYRRAWECLPSCFLQTRGFAATLEGKDTGEAVELPTATPKRPLKGRANEASNAPTSMNRASSPVKGTLSRKEVVRLPAFPLHTLGRIQETSNRLYLLHDLSDVLKEGDILKIGLLQGLSYTIQSIEGKIICIDPAFELPEGGVGEPIATNCPYLNSKNFHLFPTYERLGFCYEMPTDDVSEKDMIKNSVKTFKDDIFAVLDDAEGQMERKNLPLTHAATHEDLWLWRCANEPDERPLWRKEYDDGRVTYRYTMRSKNKFQTHFRVNVPVSLVEVLCVDARCPSLTIYSQRIDCMALIPLEKFTQIVFKKLMEWHPQSPHGIEGSKWIKFLRETEIFPDLRKPLRMSQMDIIFKLEAKGPHGYSEKFVNYQGFCKMLRKVAMARYPLEDPIPYDSERIISSRPHSPSKGSPHDQAEQSYRKLIMMHITGVTSWLDPIWEEAKLLAIDNETRRYCAATRIAAFYRGQRLRYYYSIYVDCIVALQANVRRKMVQFRQKHLITCLGEDWVFRQRIHCATLLQSVIRSYYVRCRYYETVRKCIRYF